MTLILEHSDSHYTANKNVDFARKIDPTKHPFEKNIKSNFRKQTFSKVRGHTLITLACIVDQLSKYPLVSNFTTEISTFLTN